jgi:hypothetical protein
LDANLITWGVAALLWLAALSLSWPLFRRWRKRRRMERCIASTGVAQMRNVLLEDGLGGMAFFEWLLLTPRDIRILITSSRNGIIFAGERMDTWAQVLGKRTIRFANPLHGLEALMTGLRHHLPNLNIEGHVLFIGDCTFPKGRPERVVTLQDLAAQQDSPAEQAVQPVLEEAWGKLRSLAREIDPGSEGYLLPVRVPPSYSRWVVIAAVLAVSAGWLFWRLQG